MANPFEELTFEKIAQYATANNLRWESFSEGYEEMFEETIKGKSYVCIEMEPNIWYHWMCWNHDHSCETLYFIKRYSTNNGLSQDFFLIGFNAEQKILDYLNENKN